jgi:hypothetical protein
MKTLNDHLSDTCDSIKENHDSLSPRLFKLYSKLEYLHECPLVEDNSLQEKIQDLSINWTGLDENEYPSLKLLRMKSYNTI